MKRLIRIGLIPLLLAGLSFPSAASQTDPQGSLMWDYMRKLFLNDDPYLFDERIKVLVPEFAEDPTQVPVSVDARALDGDIRQIIAWADFNPIQHIFTYRPLRDVHPRLSLRIKVQQATPIRAAVQTMDGTWHVGTAQIDAAGGGCTTPSVGNADPYWESHLGEISSRRFSRDFGSRYKFKVIHPMDTGLVDLIPEFYLQQVTLKDEAGNELLQMDLSQPVSENPVLTFDTKNSDQSHYLLLRDNNGNEFEQAL
ncbi:quinoprotein dehydrogenase-associated SoxYZ-like carrier [Marinobacterium jannaschii]|uniref:quinoprotein dehydrogenase-associated SoxYZ-like carrier n=1 Tax=Marinobacterium jannaschii TaxID=64970 RepID=UPI000563BA6A|nr:quinoprotein dehydrogenase-associated SoxYZ-like carrier [Marinobacterium jannaschii]